MRTLRLVLEYDGTNFFGWQQNPGVRTVQGTLLAALRRMTAEAGLRVQGASRTDSGVHARGQVASFDTASSIPPLGFERGLSSQLPDDLVVVSCEEAKPGFQARHRALGKRYLYLLLNQETRSPLLHRRTWWIRRQLDMAAMASAAADLVGPHDFSAFRAAGCTASSPCKELYRVEIGQDPALSGVVRVEVEGNAFLKYMVRNIVGTLVQVGLGRWPTQRVAEVLRRGDRSQAGPTAPARGLCLEEVYYQREQGWVRPNDSDTSLEGSSTVKRGFQPRATKVR